MRTKAQLQKDVAIWKDAHSLIKTECDRKMWKNQDMEKKIERLEADANRENTQFTDTLKTIENVRMILMGTARDKSKIEVLRDMMGVPIGQGNHFK